MATFQLLLVEEEPQIYTWVRTTDLPQASWIASSHMNSDPKRVRTHSGEGTSDLKTAPQTTRPRRTTVLCELYSFLVTTI